MPEKKTPSQGATDAVEVRAAEIARREGRTAHSDKDRKRAFAEMKKTAPPADHAS